MQTIQKTTNKDIFFLPNTTRKNCLVCPACQKLKTLFSKTFLLWSRKETMILLSQKRTMHISNLKSTDPNKFEALSIDFWRNSIILKNTEDINTKFPFYFSVQYRQLYRLLVCSRTATLFDCSMSLTDRPSRNLVLSTGCQLISYDFLIYCHFQDNWIPTSSHKDMSCTLPTMLQS